MKNTKSHYPGWSGRCALSCALLMPGAALMAQDTLVIEREGADSVRAGERYEYQLEVTNPADTPVRDVKIEEFVPGGSKAGAERSQAGPSGSAQQASDGDKVRTTIPYLGAGESKSVTVSGVAREEGQLRSCMAVDFTPAVCSDIEVVKPDVALNCEMARPERTAVTDDGLTAIYACDTVAINCTVTNEGSGETRESTLALNLPEGMSLEEGEAESRIGSIAAGESEEVSFVLASDSAGSYSIAPELQTSDGTAEARAIEFQIVQPELELAVQSPNEEYVNRPVTYSVHVRNTGDVAVPQTVLTIDPPEQLENVSISSEVRNNGAEEYDFRVLEPGATRTVNVRGDAVESGEAELSATARGYCVEEITRTASVPLRGVPALVLVAYDEQDPVVVGDETRYDVKVKNQGTAPAENLRITAELGDQFQFVEGEGDTDVQGDGTSVEFAPVDELAPGETVAWTIAAKADEPGYARFNVEMDSSATRRTIQEQEPTRIIE